jgi:hypothetical protein
MLLYNFLVEDSIMKQLIFTSLCLVFLIGTAVFADSYTVTGHVYYKSTGLPVNGACVGLTCTWGTNNECSAGCSCCTTTNANGYFSTGFEDCGDASAACQSNTSCVGRTMKLTATKNNYSSSTQWLANGSTESKNIYIVTTINYRDDICAGSHPGEFTIPGTQAPQIIDAYVEMGGEPALVTSFTTTLAFDPQKMTSSGATPMPPFNGSFYCNVDNILGTLTVHALSTAGPIPLGNEEYPTPLFQSLWNVNTFTTPDLTHVTTSETTELVTLTGTVNPIRNRVEYLIGSSESCKPYFRIDKEEEWQEALSSGHVHGLTSTEWADYMAQSSDPDAQKEGLPYPSTTFLPPELYVYGGGGGGGRDPSDAGLVMHWNTTGLNGTFASAYKYDYLLDPDLSNCTISVAVTAPQFDLNGSQINQVSLGLKNIPAVGGPIRAWYWNCGAAGSGAPITWGTPTVITIDTAKVGLNAATPAATGYVSNPGFNIKAVQWIVLDENGNWVGGQNPAPGPGGAPMFLWNYWHWLTVSPKTTLSKEYYTKWSQPPVVADSNYPPIIFGWDELSSFGLPVVADDWKCTDNRPVTDIHWWGSFIGWNQPYPPPIVPNAFHIGIWTDVPDDPCNPNDFSHPGWLIWENYCDNFVWNFAGNDRDPRIPGDPCHPTEPTDSCFQYNQLLTQEEWFYQEHGTDPNGRVYWLSIAPIYDNSNPGPYPWGWKTRPHFFNDDAVSIQQVSVWPPVVGATLWKGGIPIKWPSYPSPEGITWDMAFELTTNAPDPTKPPSADLNHDGIVDFYDFAIFANQWLTAGP